MANTLKFGNGNWATKEGYTLAYNDENNNFKPLPFSFERDSRATVVNKDGLIELVGAGMPRIDYKDDSEGALLLEPSSTNLVTYSEDFSNAAWSKANMTITDNGEVGIDGKMSASIITATTVDPYIGQTVSMPSTGGVNASIYIKGGSAIGKSGRLLIKAGTATMVNQTKTFTITNEWQRVIVSGTLSTIGTMIVLIEIPDGAIIGETVFLTSVMVESNSYATSYIPTSGSAVTRDADMCNNGGNEQVFNDSEGVLFVETSALADLDDTRYITLNDGTSSVNRLSIQYRNSGELRLYNGGTSTAQMIYRDSSANLTENLKIAIKYGTTSSSYKVYINGISKTIESAFVATAMSGLDNLKLTDVNGSGSPFLGRIKQVQYYNTALTDQELKRLTR